MKKIIFSFIFSLAAICSFAQTTITAVANGNWTNPATWSPVREPVAGDAILIPDNITVTIPNFNFLVRRSVPTTIQIGGTLIFDGICDLQLRSGSMITVCDGGVITTSTCAAEDIFIKMCHPSTEEPTCVFSGAELCSLTMNVPCYQLTSSGSALPVELVKFTARLNNNEVLLNWQTASERDNSGFYIERSHEGINWSDLTFIQGRGTTTTTVNYDYTDQDPISGSNYYRLRQTDFDGNTNYSPIVKVETETKNVVHLFPNPTTSTATVTFTNQKEDDGKIYVTSITGETVLEKDIDIQKGNNTIALDVNILTTGMYFVRLEIAETTQTMRMSVNR